MRNRDDIRTVDTLLEELSNIYKNDYVAYKNHKKPYKNIIDKVKSFKNSVNSSDLILAIQEKLDDKETFLNLEASIWGNLFIIIGLFTAIFADKDSIAIVIIIAPIEIFLYCISVLGCLRRKNKEKCFYKFVYNILTQKEN
ncbi:MAG: hypothetical protein PHX08_05885 [Lachnospiraceae bacterium]|nr:hypothetical protein [Lachnospiraceae bacterium]